MMTSLLLATALATAQQPAATTNKTYLLGFHADWCPKCKALEPKVMGAEKDLMKSGIEMVTIDRTNADTEKKSLEEAKKLRLDGFAKQFTGTGYGVLINARDMRVVSKVTSDMTTAQITSAAKVAAEKRNTKLYAVAFHADWCPGCKQLGPKIMPHMKDVGAMGAEMIKLDYTNDETKKSIAEQAKWLGISDVVEKNPGTGKVLLIDPVTKKVLGQISADVEASRIPSIVKTALGKTAK